MKDELKTKTPPTADEIIDPMRLKLQAILDSMADGIYIVNSNNDIEYINPVLQEVFGPNEGKKCYEYLHKRDNPCPWCRLNDVLAGESTRRELFIESNHRAYDLIGTPIYNADGSISKLEILRDITERKEAEETIKQSEAKYHSLFTTMLNGFALHEVVFDEDGNPIDHVFLEINPAFEKLTGLKRENIIGRKATEIFAGIRDLDFDWIGILNRVAVTGEETRFEEFHGSLDRWFSIIAFSPKKNFFAVVFEDISERKIASEALKREANVKAVVAEISRALITPVTSIEDMSALILQYARLLTGSEHGYVSSVDPITKALTGHTLTEMMGKQCRLTGEDNRIVFPIGENGKYNGIWGYALNIRKGFYTNEPKAHPSFSDPPEGHIPINNFLSAPALYGGELIGQIALANTANGYTDQDLEIAEQLANLYAVAVERFRADEELKRKNTELEHALNVKNEFLSMVSHELRTPLVPIIGYSDLLIDGILGEMPADAAEPIAAIKNRAEDLAILIEDLLLLSRMDRESLSLDIKPIDVGEHVGEIITDYNSVQHVKPVSIEWTGEDFTIFADHTRFHQIFRNLVENAIKYSDDTARITFHSHRENSNGIISVSDNGIGIPEEHLSRVFERFFQVEDLDIRMHDGTGLGLAITRELTEMMGGTISVSSEVGKGSTFTVTLPLA